MHCEDNYKCNDDHSLNSNIHVDRFLKPLETGIVFKQGKDLKKSEDAHKPIQPW